MTCLLTDCLIAEYSGVYRALFKLQQEALVFLRPAFQGVRVKGGNEGREVRPTLAIRMLTESIHFLNHSVFGYTTHPNPVLVRRVTVIVGMAYLYS